jgi:thiol-disulfide isomerase/thioredoxin
MLRSLVVLLIAHASAFPFRSPAAHLALRRLRASQPRMMNYNWPTNEAEWPEQQPPQALPGDPQQFLGRDPRHPPLWIAQNGQLLAELDAASSLQPKEATTSYSPYITPIRTVGDFESALAHATAQNKPLVIKYYAGFCRKCLQVKPLFERLAMTHAADVAFCEAEYESSRVLFSSAEVKKLPVAHVYNEFGELVDARMITNKERVGALSASLDHHAQGYSA